MMDKKSSRANTAIVVAAGAALSAVVLYFVAKYYDRKVLAPRNPCCESHTCKCDASDAHSDEGPLWHTP